MNIGIIGYGKMGKAIEVVLLERGHNVVFTLDKTPNKRDLKTADAAIEFSQPNSAVVNIRTCLEYGTPIVSGTTGWLSKYDEIKEFCLSRKGSFFYASNFSLGVNLFFELNRRLARLLSGRKDYACEIEEIHHTQKLDAPSGTAISLAEAIIEENRDYSNWKLEDSRLRKLDANTIPIHAKRIDKIPFTHTIKYHSDIDSISISHTAHTRRGFALGAVLAAEWIAGKEGVFSMNDILNISP